MQSLKRPISIEPLREEDFHLFYSSYREVIRKKIPSFDRLLFLAGGSEIARHISSPALVKNIEEIFSCSHQRGLCRCLEQTVIFTVSAGDRKIVAVVGGVDSYFINHVSSDWLEDFRNTVISDFLMIKGAGIDPETGLPNSRQFYTALEQWQEDEVPSLLFIELLSGARSLRESQIHTGKAVRSLKDCICGEFPLFYMGNQLFAVIGAAMDGKRCYAFARKMLSWLRGEGFRKIHIGMRWGNELPSRNESKISQVVDQAYFALQTAGRRGPFSVYDYDRLQHPEKHPLRKPSRSLLAKFRRRWQGMDHFSIVLFQTAQSEDAEGIQASLVDDIVIREGPDVYVLLPDIEAQEALQWSRARLSDMKVGDTLTGVACFPYSSFTKSRTLFNCRKALHHASFFGARGSAVFDAVSLNISGDIYYSDGDLAAAVREYKAGLACDPGNTNLLNSLGVSYADMDKHKEAIACFEKVLSLDSTDFMALYNAGLGADSIGRHSDAVEYFERACRLDTEFNEEKDNLAFHLGRLYSLTKRHDKAIELLLPWYEKKNRSKAKALHYLGRSYYGLGHYYEAMTWLQRALKYNECDAESMGLLGLVYLIRKEGDDIALTLCKKSIDIEPDNPILKLSLAKAQIACGLHDMARKTLRTCLRNKATRTEAQLLSALNYKEEGRLKRSLFWIDALLENTAPDDDIAAQAYLMKEEIDDL